MTNMENNKYLKNIFTIGQSNAFKQVLFMIGIALSVAVGIFIYKSIQDPLYRPLDYKLTDKNAATIADTLDKAHIQYKINDITGIIMVAAKDVQIAKYKLSAAGIQKDDSLNFSYLNDQSTLGESQFIENARYLRALEGDLVKTITAIDGVSAAKVHIAMPGNNIFADENNKPTASIFITVSDGFSAEKQKVRSIIQIVASSIPGLDPKNVAITDQYGHYLSSSMSEDAIQNAEQMDYQANVQNYYEKRIESLISPLIGNNKVNVRVHANVDFSQQEEATEKYDPDQKVIRSEETTSEEMGTSSAGGAAGALANSPPVGGSDTSGKTASATSNQGRSQNIKNYELGKSVLYRKSNIAKITSMSVAVVVDNDSSIDAKTKKSISKPIDKERLDKITQLVKATIGYDEKRGDIVTVLNSTFNVMPIDAPIEKTPFWYEGWFWEIVAKVASIIFALSIFFLLYRRQVNYFSELEKNSTVSSQNQPDESGLTPEMRQLKQEQINQLKEVASKDPNRVALVLKSWVTER